MRNHTLAVSRYLRLVLALSLLLLAALPFTIVAQDMMGNGVFASVRVYDGVDPADHDEIARLTAAGFLPIMRASDGFVGYYLLPAGDVLASVSLFESAEKAAASNEIARDFVAENLAPLLPHAPTIVEGALDVWQLASLEDMMMGAGESRLYASMRHYENYDLTRRDEAVELVRTLFLPMQQEAEGFFSYFTMDDGVDQVVTLSVYDTEANALAANELAAEFVSEYMTDWISQAPTRINGSMAVAAFAELNEGVNLVEAAMTESKVFASVRVYDGVDPMDQDEIARLTAAGFLPIMRASDGFVGYYLLPAGDRLASVSLFDSAQQAAASTEKARDFVAENLAPLLPNAPLIVEGVVEVSTMADAEAMTGDERLSPSHALLAIYDGFDMALLDETVTLVESVFLPELRADGGLFSYYGISDGVDKVVALRIMDSEESLQRGSDIAADFIAEHMNGWLPPDPLQAAGQLAVAALRAIDEGANLANNEPSDSVFVSIRHYAGLDPDGQDELYRLTAEGFLPMIRDSEGYIGYYWLHEGENAVAVSLFESQEQASASTESAREYVAENLAHLLAGPPRTVEGQVDIGFVELLDGMSDGAVSSLYASVRIYDGFAADDLDEFVAIVEDGFLPIMRETDGFFGYYLMHDDAGALSAISIFDSEASSLASNENAREFVAENLTAYLPSAPSIVGGRVGIASLADVNDAANLIDDPPVFVSIRIYDDVDPMDRDEIVRLVDPDFLSIMRESDGFVAYYLLPAGDKLAAISVFDSAEQATASNEKARDYVAEFMAPLLPNAPMIVEGHIDVMYVNDADDMMMADGMPALYASLRIYDVPDIENFDAANELVKAYLLPALHEAGGLVSYYALNDGDDTIAGLNVYVSEEQALAANDIAAAFNAEHITDSSPNVPLLVNGQLGVAALVEINRGENLVRALME